MSQWASEVWFVALILLAYVLFKGEPDLHDALIERLSARCSDVVASEQR